MPMRRPNYPRPQHLAGYTLFEIMLVLGIIAVLVGSAAGKRWREAFSAFDGLADSVVATEVAGTASEPAAAIAAYFAQRGIPCTVAADAADGLRQLRSRPGPRVVTGSFYLAGAVRRLLDASL